MAAAPGSLLKFGEDCELDLRAYELRRGGRPVRLERIPMAILIMLADRRPQLVTREEIVEKIWGKGVFFDTDNSINVAIRKIRHALKDEPDHSRFIRTITGMGYRFIAAVTEDGAAQPEPAAAARAAAEAIPAPPPLAVPVAVPGRPTATRRWAVALAVLTLAAAGVLYHRWSRSGPAAGQPLPRPMLVVLPFENLTGDAGQDYFADGFTEEMITRLGSLDPARLGVIARTSSMFYRHANASLDRIGRELSVRYALEGSVRSDAGRVRITAQLIQVADQTHLWAHEYDRDRTDVLRVQEEIAAAIGDQIQLALDASDRPSPRAAPLSRREFEAYDLCLKGRFSWNKRTPAGFQEALTLFQQAADSNPDEAHAYVGLADDYSLMVSYGLAPRDEVIPKARAAALRALEIDPGLAAAHTSIALINEQYDWDWATAGDRFRRAIELDPNYVTAHHWYAEYLGFEGRFDEALAESEKARRLDPLSHIIAADRGAILYYARRNEEAIAQLQEVLAADPGDWRAHLILLAYAQAGRFDAALEHLRDWERMEPGFWQRAYSAYVYGRMGRMSDARQAAAEVAWTHSGRKGELEYAHFLAALGLGLNDEALGALEKVGERPTHVLVDLAVDPIYDPLRADPRFKELLRRVFKADTTPRP